MLFYERLKLKNSKSKEKIKITKILRNSKIKKLKSKLQNFGQSSISTIKNHVNIIERNISNVTYIAQKRNQSMNNIDFTPLKQPKIKTNQIIEESKIKNYSSKKTFQYYSDKKSRNELPIINKSRNINYTIKQDNFPLNSFAYSNNLPKFCLNVKAFLRKKDKKFDFLKTFRIKK